MFNLAIDSKLRGCDVVAMRVEHVAASGYTADRATVRQRETGRPVTFELSEQTRQAIDDYLKAANKRPGEFLFTGRRGPETSITTRHYARLVSEWTGSVGLDPRHAIGCLSGVPRDGTTHSGLAGWRRSNDRTGLQPNSLQTGNFSGNFAEFGPQEASALQGNAGRRGDFFQNSLIGLSGKVFSRTGILAG